MAAYYNEIEPYAAEWLRNLIRAGLIADGEVDGRSIVDVRPDDLRGFTQCHFFAGIGVWSHALRLAGWPDDRPVWTGSCPCQPFSAAGKQKGFEDERHLWPVFHRLIDECRPPVVFGEQVASKDGLQWLDAVFADLEESGYAAGAADLCAAGVGAPHIRQRLWFVGERLDDTAGARHVGALAVPEGEARNEARMRVSGEGRGVDGLAHSDREDQRGRGVQRPGQGDGARDGTARERFARLCANGGLGHHHHQGLEGQRDGHQAASGRVGTAGSATETGEPRGLADAHSGERHGLADGEGRERDGTQTGWQQGNGEPQSGGEDGGLADTPLDGRRQGVKDGGRLRSGDSAEGAAGRPAIDSNVSGGRPRPTNGHWRDADWLHCRDGRWRPVEPGTFPLAHGAASRVGRLRAYGNAIVPQAAAEMIGAYMDVCP